MNKKKLLEGSLVEPESKYVTGCVLCGATRNLVMIPHRDNLKRLVGWVFGCIACTDLLYNSDITISIEGK